jgi:hypothetical protein
MQSSRTGRTARAAKSRWRAALKATLASVTGIAVAALFGLLVYCERPQPAATLSAAVVDDGSVSIIYPLANGIDCHKVQMDGVTGHIKDNGTSDCGAVPHGQGTRLGAISKGFRDR